MPCSSLSSHMCNVWFCVINNAYLKSFSLQWNVHRNPYIVIPENAFENVFCEMASILPRPQCVKTVMIIQELLGGNVNLFAAELEAFLPRNMSGDYRISRTVQCWYDTVNFPTNTHKIHPLARPLGRGLGRLCGSSMCLIYWIAL